MPNFMPRARIPVVVKTENKYLNIISRTMNSLHYLDDERTLHLRQGGSELLLEPTGS